MSSDYIIEERVIERAKATYPDIPEIVPSSTPVVSFGYPNKAIVATLGINPSSNEFQVGNGNKNLLGFGSKKLVDTEVLGVDSPKHLNREQALEVIKGCYSYFSPQGKPLKWFDPLQLHVLDPINASYASGTACHLDLVQWATDPVWQHKKMNKHSKKILLENDKEFLKFQLSNYDFKYVFLNGSTVISQVEKLGIVKLEKVAEVRFNRSGTMSHISRGNIGSKEIIGWGLNVGYGATLKEGLEDLQNWITLNIKKIS